MILTTDEAILRYDSLNYEIVEFINGSSTVKKFIYAMKYGDTINGIAYKEFSASKRFVPIKEVNMNREVVDVESIGGRVEKVLKYENVSIITEKYYEANKTPDMKQRITKGDNFPTNPRDNDIHNKRGAIYKYRKGSWEFLAVANGQGENDSTYETDYETDKVYRPKAKTQGTAGQPPPQKNQYSTINSVLQAVADGGISMEEAKKAMEFLQNMANGKKAAKKKKEEPKVIRKLKI